MWAACSFLITSKVPHNMIISGGAAPRVYLFPRQRQALWLGGAMKVAVAEVAGLPICKTSACFDSLTAEGFYGHLKDDVALPAQVWLKLCFDIELAVNPSGED